MRTVIRSLIEAIAPHYWYRFQIYRERRYDPMVKRISRLCQKDAVSIDVGANRGMYSYHMLDHSFAVVAYEPVPEMCSKMETFFGNSMRIYPVALSDLNGERELRQPGKNTARATIEDHNGLDDLEGRVIKKVLVKTCRLDEYEFGKIGFIKIDVEGHEEAVLRGATRVIERDKPSLLIEIEERHNPGSVARVRSFLEGFGYRGFFFDNETITPMEKFIKEHNQVSDNLYSGGAYVNNFIFLRQGASW